ncbi:MAG: sulfatase-like hydrolase/transferase [Thermomicrobiales bacterium]
MTERPNILVMIADDHRYSAIGANGDPVVQTPVLDGLAAGGTSFDQAHIQGGLTGAICVPSRACLLTGANVFRAAASREIGDQHGLRTLNPALATLPAVFRQAGYHTHAIGKWHNDTTSFANGFQDGARLFFGGMSDHDRVPLHAFDPTGSYPPDACTPGDGFSTDLFRDAAIDFLNGYQEHDPFFLYLAFTAPHDPRTPPPDYAARYDPDRIPLPPNFLPEHPFDNGEMRVRDELLDAMPRTPEMVRRHIAGYYGMISHLDARIGTILDTLAATGRAENTIVVYTADHGLALGQHGLLGKQNLYEHSNHIPMILRGPGVPAGTRIDALTYLADLFPTLCDLTGTPIPETVESQSLVPLITGEQALVRDRVYAVYKDVQRMVSDGRWKLIRYHRSAACGNGTDRLQLFDLATDPWETRDRSGEPEQQESIRALTDDLAAWQREVGDPLPEQPARH